MLDPKGSSKVFCPSHSVISMTPSRPDDSRPVLGRPDLGYDLEDGLAGTPGDVPALAGCAQLSGVLAHGERLERRSVPARHALRDPGGVRRHAAQGRDKAARHI